MVRIKQLAEKVKERVIRKKGCEEPEEEKSDAMDRVYELVVIKKQNVQSEEDKEKIYLIDSLFKDEGIFFKMPAKLSICILEFLDVPKDEILPLYKELISFQSYLKRMPRERIMITGK